MCYYSKWYDIVFYWLTSLHHNMLVKNTTLVGGCMRIGKSYSLIGKIEDVWKTVESFNFDG